MANRSASLKEYGRDLRTPRGPVDIPFLMLTLLLLTIGVVMVLSASYASAYYDLNNETNGNATYYFARQLFFALLGIVIMLVASRLPMSFYRRFSFAVLAVAIVLLMAVLVIGTKSHGARRWILIAGISLQPSEIAKIGVILYFSVLICRYKNLMGTFKYGVAPFGIILLVIIGLLALEPHLSASIIIILIGAIMMFVGGARLFWFIGGGIGVAGMLFIALNVLQYSADRI